MINAGTSGNPQTIAALPAGQAAIAGVDIGPVPAKDSVNFIYDLDSSSDIEIDIYDRTGALVSEIRETQPAGRGRSIWNSSRVGTGAYIAVLRIKPSAGSERTYRKKIFIER